MISRRLLPMLALGALSCASARGERFVERSSAIRPDVGYLAAFLAIDHDTQTFLLSIEGPDGAVRDLPFRDPSVAVPVDLTHPANQRLTDSKQVGMIALAPGDHRVARWWVDEPGPAALPKTLPPGHPLAKPFPVRAGRVVFLGSFTARQVRNSNHNVVTTTSTIDAQPLTDEEAWTLFLEAYPGFADAPFECRLCDAGPAVR